MTVHQLRQNTDRPAPRKTCSKCGFKGTWDDFYPKARWEDGTVRRVNAWCKTCSNANSVAAKRERRKQLRQDPEEYARYLEREREYHATHRRKYGAQPRERYEPVTGKGVTPLPIGPWQDWIRREVRRRGLTLSEFAELLGLNERRVRFWLDPVDPRTGKRQESIGLETADRLFCRLGDPYLLYETWPHLMDDDEEQEAA